MITTYVSIVDSESAKPNFIWCQCKARDQIYSRGRASIPWASKERCTEYNFHHGGIDHARAVHMENSNKLCWGVL